MQRFNGLVDVESKSSSPAPSFLASGGGEVREQLDDVAEDMADKLGVYGEERQHWVYEFKQRIKAAVELDELLRPTPSQVPGPTKEE